LFTVLTALQSALEGISGDITPATVIARVKAMPEKDLPGETGLKFRCNGKASSLLPATCVRGGLVTTLDDKGQPSSYKALGVSPIAG
jgi:branched-chain amino acid transport system substrate-binding protein